MGNCNRKHIWRMLQAALIVFVIIYLLLGAYLGCKVRTIVVSAFDSDSYVENNPYMDVISDEAYNYFVKSPMFDMTSPDARYEYKIYRLPLVIHWFTGAKVCLYYKDGYYVGDKKLSGSTAVPIWFTLELCDGKWNVIDYYEAP